MCGAIMRSTCVVQVYYTWKAMYICIIYVCLYPCVL